MSVDGVKLGVFDSPMVTKTPLLLHVCCAPCSTYVIETLKDEFNLVAYFYNPNIHPEEEYQKRLDELIRFAEKMNVPVFEGEYDKDRWLNAVKGHENDREGGERCEICYKLRMEDTAIFAVKNGFMYFGTVLSASPHKDAEVINRIGEEISRKYDINFYQADFKREGGFKESVELSKKYGLYRQKYCGCIYSIPER